MVKAECTFSADSTKERELKTYTYAYIKRMLENDEIIEKKQNAITEAQETIADAKEQQKVRYEEMKQRIQFLYEEGNTSYLDVFLSASSFSDLLNKADYIEMI